MHRDPETGQFVAEHGDNFDDIEIVSFTAGYGVEAANLTGGTSFDPADSFTFSDEDPLIDYDEIVDRNEELRLLKASHVLTVWSNSTQTADGTVSAAVGLRTAPTRVAAHGNFGQTPGNTVDGDVVGRNHSDDSIDAIGRQLAATAHAPFSDGASGVGGGGSAGEDRAEHDMFPGEFGRFHPRDELFATGEILAWNIDDSGVHLEVSGQHVYGVVSD